MIEFLPIQIASATDWSLLFAVIAGIAFFFGKLIREASPYRDNKYSTYVDGFAFVVLFVVFPPLVLYTIFESHFIPIPYLLALLIQFIMASFVGRRLIAYTKIQRLKTDKYVSELAKKKTDKIIKENKLLEKYASTETTMNVFNVVFFKEIPSWLLMLLALLNYWSFASILSVGAKPLIVFTSFLFMLVIMICMAVMFAQIKYKCPQVIVHINNGEKLKGELSKIDGGYVNIVKNNRVYHINESQVIYIEVPIFLRGSKRNLENKVLGNSSKKNNEKM